MTISSTTVPRTYTCNVTNVIKVVFVMTENYLFVAPYKNGAKRRMWALIDATDSHKWVFGIEKGKGGYMHIQARIRVGNDGFDHIKAWFPEAHIEKCADKWTYERKDGRFASSEDTDEVRKQRFGHPRGWQKTCIRALKTQNDRQIDVMYDPVGNMGKSWLVGHLFETGKAHVVQAQNTAKGLIQDCASEYIDNGYKPICIIDIPRTWKWTDDIYVAIERIKDGLIKDPRYGSRTINIHGVKVLVMCNAMPKVGNLSADRWRIATLS